MKKFIVFLIVEASSKSEAMEQIDEEWGDIDPNLDFSVTEITTSAMRKRFMG